MPDGKIAELTQRMVENAGSAMTRRSYRSVTGQTLHYLVRPHTHIPRTPIEHEAAWRGDELQDDDRWIERLDDDALEEIERALQVAEGTGKDIREMTATDFPLPTLGRRIRRWRQAVHDGLGVQVVRGVPVQRWSQRQAQIFFWCLGQHLGVPGVQNREGDILGHVRSTGASYDDSAIRGYKTDAHLAYHCDAADAVGLLCLHPAKEGGRSRFVSSVTVYNEFLERRPDLVDRLFEPFHLDTRGDGGLNFFPISPCRYADGILRTFYHGDYFRTSARQPGAPSLSSLDHEVLDTYDAITNEPGVFLEMDFEPGDIQLLSNHTVLHSRTGFVDYEDPAKKRHLLRLWLSFDTTTSWRARPSKVAEGARLLGELVRGRIRDRNHVPKT
jgi:hypothetical protein